MLIKAGVDGKATVFLFSDNQIKEESFVEDINMILNTGDVPNIFPADEKADVIEKMQTVARVEVGWKSPWFAVLYPFKLSSTGLLLLVKMLSAPSMSAFNCGTRWFRVFVLHVASPLSSYVPVLLLNQRHELGRWIV